MSRKIVSQLTFKKSLSKFYLSSFSVNAQRKRLMDAEKEFPIGSLFVFKKEQTATKFEVINYVINDETNHVNLVYVPRNSPLIFYVTPLTSNSINNIIKLHD